MNFSGFTRLMICIASTSFITHVVCRGTSSTTSSENTHGSLTTQGHCNCSVNYISKPLNSTTSVRPTNSKTTKQNNADTTTSAGITTIKPTVTSGSQITNPNANLSSLKSTTTKVTTSQNEVTTILTTTTTPTHGTFSRTVTSTSTPYTSLPTTTTHTNTNATKNTTTPKTIPTTSATPTTTPTTITTPKTNVATTATADTTKRTADSMITTNEEKRDTNGPGNEDFANYDDMEGYIDDYCYKLCHNNLSNTVTTTQSTTTIKHRLIKLDDKNIDIKRVIIVNDSYNETFGNITDDKYDEIVNTFNSSLTGYYRRILNGTFLGVSNISFTEGSIKCNYDLNLKSPTTGRDANYILQALTNESNILSRISNWTVKINETFMENTNLVNIDDFIPKSACSSHEVGKWLNDGTPTCEDKCDQRTNKQRCGFNGTCVTDTNGEVMCNCKSDTDNVYTGEFCNISISLTTTIRSTPATSAVTITPEKITKTEIIGIAAGSGGAVVVILLIALICVCRKLTHAKKKNDFPDNYTDDDKEVLRDNSRIENVPDLRPGYSNSAYHSAHDNMQMQRFEHEEGNVGHRNSYHLDENPYRKIVEPDIGNVVIYQPSGSQLSRTDQSELSSYSMIDSENSYKIRRPAFNRNVPYN